MRSRTTIGTFLSLLATLPPALVAQDPAAAQGTYSFRIYSADRQEIVAEGRFVLSAEELDLDSLDQEVLSAARERSYWLLRAAERGERPVRVCFGFERSRSAVDGREFYGGIIPVGLSTWTVEDGEVRIHVYQSPDASQHLSGRLTETGLEGIVLQGDHNAYSTGAPLEWLPFEAERTAEASMERCEEVLRIGGAPRPQSPAELQRSS